MKEIIEQRIEKVYGSKKAFCEANGYDPKTFSKKIRTVKGKQAWLNEFLGPLGLTSSLEIKKVV